MSLAPSCSATTNDGRPCRFAARKATGLCINHDPAYRHQQAVNSAKGVEASRRARRRVYGLAFHQLDLTDRAGAQAALDAVIRLELAGQIPNHRARNLIRALSIAAHNFDPPPTRDRYRGMHAEHDRDRYDWFRANLDRNLESLIREANAQDEARNPK